MYIFWLFDILLTLKKIVKRNSQTRELEKYYHLFGWGVPLLFVMGVGIAKSYGPTGAT